MEKKTGIAALIGRCVLIEDNKNVENCKFYKNAVECSIDNPTKLCWKWKALQSNPINSTCGGIGVEDNIVRIKSY